MSTPAQAILNVRGRTISTVSNYPDAVALMHYNYAYQDVTGDIQLLDEEYFFDVWLSSTVIWQIEYAINQIGIRDINQLERVELKYTTDQQYFTTLRRENPDNLPYSKDYYTKWSKADPFYYIQDNSIWVFPAVEVSVTNWLRVEAIVQPPDLLTSDTIDKVLIPKRIQRIIEDWMMSYAYEYLGKDAKVANAIALYDKRKKEALEQVKKRDSGIVQQPPVNITSLQ